MIVDVQPDMSQSGSQLFLQRTDKKGKTSGKLFLENFFQKAISVSNKIQL